MPDEKITAMICPDCTMIADRWKMVPVENGWTEWRCWSCDHRFGTFANVGALDLGVTDE